MKGYQFWALMTLWFALTACSPSVDVITTPTVDVKTSTTVLSTPTPIATNILTATFTPLPTQTPSPTATSTSLPATSTAVPTPDIQFSADRSYIKVGMCVIFTWNIKNGKAVYFYAEGEPWEDKLVLSGDSREECRTESTMYYLRVVGLDDAVEIREIHIPVEPMPGL